MVSDISGVPLPRMRFPDSLVMVSAALLTWLAALTKQPPMWQMSTDLVWTVREGAIFDGSKVERELGITYTPIRAAVEREVASYKQ
jgi:dihydroflavonol-4-reductase